jgi:hypothetical protein
MQWKSFILKWHFRNQYIIFEESKYAAFSDTSSQMVEVVCSLKDWQLSPLPHGASTQKTESTLTNNH